MCEDCCHGCAVGQDLSAAWGGVHLYSSSASKSPSSSTSGTTAACCCVSARGPFLYAVISLSYLALSCSDKLSYFDLVSGSAAAQRLPNSLAISPIVYSGLFAFTFERSSLQNQKKADSDLLGALGSFICCRLRPRTFMSLGGT